MRLKIIPKSFLPITLTPEQYQGDGWTSQCEAHGVSFQNCARNFAEVALGIDDANCDLRTASQASPACQKMKKRGNATSSITSLRVPPTGFEPVLPD